MFELVISLQIDQVVVFNAETCPPLRVPRGRRALSPHQPAMRSGGENRRGKQ